MQIPGTQLGVSRNCSRPRATFPCWAKLHEIITQLQVPFTVKAQRTGIAGHLERQEYNPQLTNCKELTPSLSPRIIICFGTILKHFCLFHTGLCISLELEKWESVPEWGHYSGVQGCIFFHSNTLLQPRWMARAIPPSCTTPGSHQACATSTFRDFHRCQAGLSSMRSADTGAFLGYSTEKWWLDFLEIISPTSGQPQEVKPILWHWADSQLTNKLNRVHLQISCARLFPHFRCVGVTHNRFILRKKRCEGGQG